MKNYKPADVRVVGLFGHRGSGKTSLAEAFLFNAGITGRLGSVDEGTTLLEIDETAADRHMTMAVNAGFVEWNGARVSILDSPGDGNFWGATRRAARVVDAGLVTISAPDGVEPMTSRAIAELRERGIPFAVMVTKLDKDGASFDAAVAQLARRLEREVAVLSLPLGSGDDTVGVINLLSGRANVIREGRVIEVDVPAEMAGRLTSARELLLDAVAAADDDLAETYLEEGTLTADQLRQGLRSAFLRGQLVPVLAGAPTRNVGAKTALDVIAGMFPAPTERPPIRGYRGPDRGELVERLPTADGPLVAQIFRTYHDPFAGMLSFARVWCGQLSSGSDVYNTTHATSDRPSHMFFPQGGTKNGAETKDVQAGDVVVLTKLKHSRTGDTLADKHDPTFLEPFDEPDALLNVGIAASDQKDEDKVGTFLHRLIEEDPSLHFHRDPDSGDSLLGGLGQSHIDYAVERLRRANLSVDLREPKVPYRETLRGQVRNVEGKHKKQTGGSGQFGVCFIHVEPLPRGAGFEFVDQVVGGAIPRQYIPSVEKGVRDYLRRGPLSGNEVVDVRVMVFDGKYHKVDSSDMAFQQAGRKAIKAALADSRSRMVLLEPYMDLHVTCPAEAVGDVMGDLSSRRARVHDMQTEGTRGKITASVPMNEILRYANVLKSLTSGRGSFTMHFERYEEAPPNVQQQVMSEYTAEHDED